MTCDNDLLWTVQIGRLYYFSVRGDIVAEFLDFLQGQANDSRHAADPTDRIVPA